MCVKDCEEAPAVSHLFSWEDSFSDFRAHCNEDERIAEHFSTSVIPHVKSFSHLSWLDIGCGDCVKAATHARLLHEASLWSRAAVTLLDPHLPNLIPAAISAATQVIQLLGDVRFLSVDLARFVREPSTTVLDFNLVTAIHSIHTAEACDALLSLLTAVPTQPKVAFIVTESEESDIYRLRRLIERMGVSVPRPYTARLSDAAKKLGATVRWDRIDAQYCRLNSDRLISDDGHWFFPFLLGESSSSFDASEPERRACVHRVVRQYVRENDKRVLAVPDDALFVGVGSTLRGRSAATDSAGE